ncbi:NADP-dependent 3-hydroxy acid dehydrogenase YdfG [Entomoplasma freundtii]|uniref:Oxidoreductase n=1 Tax=Entomoplasma freundtii TaxID=74700 RepID=A0A2K8NR19_9MOLU|nr:SDR family oxidoreductase [Entomoplasma freundtii]ATZ16290.1 oxidoreductase [Entomoplasma freundtii]TDY56808.1 NADP-dependent 3-hydroxy acid dehydrogenase YdfG [Entomoplasma freundtii]
MDKKVVVITGASSGIGAALAKLLGNSNDDYQLVLGARREVLLKALVQEIESDGGEAIYQVTDIRQIAEVEKLAQAAINHFGKIDVWVNNAGIYPGNFLSDRQYDDWDRLIDTNLKGTLYGIGTALQWMIPRNNGQIINISSVAAHVVSPISTIYSATKAAILAINEGLRQEVSSKNLNIRVTAISPGFFNTEIINDIKDAKIKSDVDLLYAKYGISPDRVALTIKQAIELPFDTSWNEVVIRPTKEVL